MKEFNYKKLKNISLNLDIINLLTAIHEYKGKQELYLENKPGILEKLTDLAIIQSTESSNKIEGIFTSDKRLKEIVQHKTKPTSRNEREIAGYRDVLQMIHENYPYIRLTPNSILQLHKNLYDYFPQTYRGKWKSSDNVITQEDSDGNKFIRFQPAPVFITPELIQQLVNEYNEIIQEGELDPLVVIPCFIFDFVSIHPFNDGNGRMSRLLTLLLLYQNDYLVGRYISIEMLIEKTKVTYYESLFESSVGWIDNKQDYIPFLRYILGIILKAYQEFEERFRVVHNKKVSSEDRVLEVINKSLIPLSKANLISLIPELSQKTIERRLNDLVSDNRIEKIGAGRGTKYLSKI